MAGGFDAIPTSEIDEIQAESLEYVAELARQQVEDVELGQAFRKLVESKSILEAFGELAKNDPNLADRVLRGAIQIAVGARSAALMEKSLRYRASKQN